MFYTLFNTVSKSTSFAGPFITAAIIKRAGGNNNVAFWFLVGLGVVALTLLWFVDTDKAKLDCAKCEFPNIPLNGIVLIPVTVAEREAQELYSEEQREANKANQIGKGDLVEGDGV